MNNLSESINAEEKIDLSTLKKDLISYRQSRKKFLDRFSYHDQYGIIYYDNKPVAEIVAENHRTKVWVALNEKYRGEGKTLSDIYEGLAAWMIFDIEKNK